jgi:hypothetical protein
MHAIVPYHITIPPCVDKVSTEIRARAALSDVPSIVPEV